MSHRHGSKTYSPTLVTDSATAPAIAAAIAAHVAAMHTPIVVPPQPVPVPPPSGIPAIPAGTGTLYRHDFATDGMGLFRALVYPNDHSYATDPSQLMRQYCKYVTDAAHISVHDGYLDLLCDRNPAVSNPAALDAWLATFVGTFDGAKFTKSFTPPFHVRYCLDFGGAATKADWRTAWVYGTWLNRDLEVPDWPEVIGGKLTANLHSPGASQIASKAIPAGWAIYDAIVTPTSVAVGINGAMDTPVAWNVGTGPLGLFLDSKVGLATPDATTGSPRLKAAWITVD